MKQKIADRLNNIIREIFGVEPTADLAMNTVSNWDSLRHIQLMARIEEEFGLELDFKDTLAMTSLEVIKQVVGKYVSEK